MIMYGKWRYSSTNLHLGLTGKWVYKLCTPVPLFPGKNLRYLLDSTVGEPQNRSRSCEEEKNLLPGLGIEPRFLSYNP
jgi:hypothetical protein